MTALPSSTVSGEADSDTGGGGASVIVTSTEFGLPARTDVGSVPSATVNVPSPVAASSFVETAPVPLVSPASTVMLAKSGSIPATETTAGPVIGRSIWRGAVRECGPEAAPTWARPSRRRGSTRTASVTARAKAPARSAFEGAKQRFFSHLLVPLTRKPLTPRAARAMISQFRL